MTVPPVQLRLTLSLRACGYLQAAIILGLLAYRCLFLSWFRAFDTDEFEHIQNAWLMAQNLCLYRDFFEHHPPLLYVMLTPLMRYFRDADVLYAARLAMVPFALGILALTAHLARKLGGRLAGVSACALLSTVVVFQQKSIEVRPDVPGVFLLLVAVALSLRTPLRRWHLAGIGLAAALALLFTPKLLFAMPAMALVGLHRDRTLSVDRKAIAWTGTAFCLPFLLTGLFLAREGALRAALFFNLGFNLAVPYTYRWMAFRSTVGGSVLENGYFWVVGAAGVAWAITQIVSGGRHGTSRRQVGVVLLATSGLGAGLFLIPVPLKQYLMAFCVLLAILGGCSLAHAVDVVTARARSPVTPVLTALLGTALLLHPIRTLGRDRHNPNTMQRHVLRYVWTTVPENARVFDCWTGRGVFRRPAFFYHFLGPDIVGALETLDPSVLRQSLVETLATVRPLAITCDPMHAMLPQDVRAYIADHYEVDAYGILLLRRDRAVGPSGPAHGVRKE